jgi:hypothetical protein
MTENYHTVADQSINTADIEVSHNGGLANPQVNQFVYSSFRNMHYHKSAVTPIRDGNKFIFTPNLGMGAFENLILTTTAVQQRSLDEMLTNLTSLQWKIGQQIVFDMSGVEIISALKMIDELYKLVNDKYQKGILIIPLQQLITHRSIVCSTKDEFVVNYKSTDHYECFCHGFQLPTVANQTTQHAPLHTLIWQYGVYIKHYCRNFTLDHITAPLSQETSLDDICISDIVVCPHQSGNYDISVNNKRVLKGDHPLNLMETGLVCDDDKYYYHSIKSDDTEHIGYMFGGLLSGRTLKLTIEPTCQQVKIIIKYKTILRHCGGYDAQVSPTLQVDMVHNRITNLWVNSTITCLECLSHDETSYLSWIDPYLISLIINNVVNQI